MTIQEFKDELRQELLQDQHYEYKLRTDYEFALEQLGVFGILENLQEASDKLYKLGWYVSPKDLLDV